MAVNPSVYQLLQVGVESGSGAVSATKRLQTIGLIPAPKTTVAPITQMGAAIDVGSILGKEWSEHKISGTGSFNELPYILGMFFGAPTITPLAPPTASPATKWVHKDNYLAVPTLNLLTAEYGAGVRDQQYASLMGSEFQVKIDRDKLELGGNLIGKALVDPFTHTTLNAVNQVWTITETGVPTGGTFTLQLGTFGAAISVPYNATAAQLQTALNAYAAPYANSFTVTGTALPAGSLAVTGTGFLSGRLLPNFTVVSGGLTGGASPTAVSTLTTPGVQVTPDTGQIQAFSPSSFNVYVDNTFGAIGTTQLPSGFDLTIDIQNRQGPVWRLNSSDAGTYQTGVPMKMKGTVQLTAMDDSVAIGYLTNMRGNTKQFLRFSTIGSSIDGTNFYTWNLDVCLQMTQPKEMKDVNGSWGVVWDGVIVGDSGWGSYLQSTLINTLAAL